jgi:hypothetical protein
MRKTIFEIIDSRIKELEEKIKKLPKEIEKDKLKHPAIKQVEGRIAELKHLKKYLHKNWGSVKWE